MSREIGRAGFLLFLGLLIVLFLGVAVFVAPVVDCASCLGSGQDDGRWNVVPPDHPEHIMYSCRPCNGKGKHTLAVHTMKLAGRE